MDNREQITEELDKYSKIENIKSHEGWPLLLIELNKVSKVIMQALLLEKDYNKIVTLQERYRAFSSVIDILSSSSLIKDKLLKDLQELINEEELKKEFDI